MFVQDFYCEAAVAGRYEVSVAYETSWTKLPLNQGYALVTNAKSSL